MGNAQFNEVYPFNANKAVDDTFSTGTFDFLLPIAYRYRVDALLCENVDTIAHEVQVISHIGGLNAEVGRVTVPIGAGTGGTPPVDLIAALLATGSFAQWAFQAGDFLELALTVAVSSGKLVNFTLLGGTL